MAAFLKVDGAATLIFLRLTPKGGRDAIDGPVTLADGRVVLGVRVRAAPENGEANAALVKLIAKTLRVPASALTLVAGHTARIKTIRADHGLDEAALAFLIATSTKG